jgi:hypothetical protein
MPDDGKPALSVIRHARKWSAHSMNKRMMEEVEMPQVKTEAPGLDRYRAQAAAFLKRFDLEVLIAYKGDLKCPPWSPETPGLQGCKRCGAVHGDMYRVTIRRAGTAVSPLVKTEATTPKRKHAVTFDFWGSLQDKQQNRRIIDFDVLATVASEASCPTEVTEVLDEFGMNRDSIRDYRKAVGIARFAARLQAFFTPEEITVLGEID